MVRTHLAVSAAILALGAPLDLPAQGATLETIAEGSDVDGISKLEYDDRSDRLLGAIGRRLVAVDVKRSGATTLVTMQNDILALALDVETSIAAVTARGDQAIFLLDLHGGSMTRVPVDGSGSPEIVVYDAATDGYVVAGDSRPSLTVVPSAGRQRQKTVGLPSPASGLAANGRGWVFATAADKPAIYIANSKKGAFLGVFPVPDCVRPRFPIVDDVERRLYVTCSNGVLVALDSDTGVVLGRTEIPKRVSDVVMPASSGRIINLVIATSDDGIWMASGRITADSASQVIGGTWDRIDLAAGPDGVVFVSRNHKVNRLTKP